MIRKRTPRAPCARQPGLAGVLIFRIAQARWQYLSHARDSRACGWGIYGQKPVAVAGHDGASVSKPGVGEATWRQHAVLATRRLGLLVGAPVWAELIQALSESSAHSLKRRELRLQRPDGSAVWIDLDVVLVCGPDDRLAHWVAVGRDVSDRKQADMATNQAKSLGRDTAAFFEPELQQAVKLRAERSADLRVALDQLGVHYQPLFDRSRRIIGLEALARWHHPARGWISPAEFIPVAEDTGLILRLGHWVLEQACAQLAAWAARPATAALSVSVNVSMHKLHHHQFVEQVLALMQAHQIKLQLLKRSGVPLSLDDFSTGYSSLAYLKSLPLGQLKIDQRFVVDVLTDRAMPPSPAPWSNSATA